MTPRRRAARRLVTRPFVAARGAALAFFTAGGMVLPGVVAVRGPGRSAPTRSAPAWRSGRSRSPRSPCARSSGGRRTASAAGRCSSAAALLTVVALLLHLAASTLPAFIAVACRVRGRRGVLLRRVPRRRQRPRAARPPRRGDQPRVAGAVPGARVRAAARRGRPGRRRLRGRLDRGGGTRRRWRPSSRSCVPETSPAVVPPDRRSASRTRLFHPAAVFPGVLVGCGAFGMAGFLAFVPLYARQVGLDGAALPLAVYALIVVGLRLGVRQAARPGRRGASCRAARSSWRRPACC